MTGGHVDPVVAALQAAQAAAQAAQSAAAAAQHQEPPQPINLTITLPPLEMHVENAVSPAPVHVDVAPAAVRPTIQPAVNVKPPTVNVTVPPTAGAKEIVFDRDVNGNITGARVVERGE